MSDDRYTQMDICFNRHGGNPESNLANKKLLLSGKKRKQRSEVIALIANAGSEGMNCKEVAAAMETGMNNVSGRLTELRRDEVIIKCGVRGGSGVYKLVEKNYWH